MMYGQQIDEQPSEVQMSQLRDQLNTQQQEAETYETYSNWPFDKLYWLAPYLVEGVGTFFLVLTVGLSAPYGDLAPLGIGSILMVLVYMGGHVSGGHYNPAVTFGVWLSGRNKISLRKVFAYFCVQFFGGLLGAFSAQNFTRTTVILKPDANTVTEGGAFGLEIYYTFVLVSTVLQTATTRSNEGNSFYGIAIGFAVLSAAIASGRFEGGGFNPAVGLAWTLVHSWFSSNTSYHLMWIYIFGPSIGAILAAMFFRITNPNEYTGKP